LEERARAAFPELDERPLHRRIANVQSLIYEWSRLTDELDREPTIKEVAERFNLSTTTLDSDLAVFRAVFPGHRNPGPIVKELWNGKGWGALIGVRMVPRV
jgi:hypothetical protein